VSFNEDIVAFDGYTTLQLFTATSVAAIISLRLSPWPFDIDGCAESSNRWFGGGQQ
jgi:hypothetical protein